MTDLARLALLRTALLSLPVLATACGGNDKPPIKDPPQATLSVTETNVVGTKVTVQVGATGCDQIESLSIYDGDTYIKGVAYSGGGQVPVEIQRNEFKYTKGIAGYFSLRAKVVCTDKLENYSQPQPVTFFPVAEVYDAPAGTQVVTDKFIAEGSGASVSFIGCGNDATGIPYLFRVTKAGGVITEKSVRMPFLCTNDTVITSIHPVSGKRWIWTPNAGAFAFDRNLNITGRTDYLLDLLAVGTDGDAIIYDAGAGGDDKALYRIAHQPSSPPVAFKWKTSVDGFAVTTPVATTDGVVLVASITSAGAPSGRARVVVSKISYGAANGAGGGGYVGTYLMKEFASAETIPTVSPPATFSVDGTLLYMAFSLQGAATELLACKTQSEGCEGTSQRWTQPPVLPRQIVATVPFANNSRLAAIAPQQVYVLDASTGAVLNKDQAPLTPEGALVVNQVQSGGGGQFPEALFVLNSAANAPYPAPLEIVATEKAANGELFRYRLNAGSMGASVDDEGTLWLRVGTKLVRPLPLSDYRQARQ
ncbi:hypothetical protein [Stigmatella erecta]|uniref:Lipoprotein n=1 Tax=Stigmatella erecta TaxID=83460 RepID=A0A1I0K4C8_9BACT|nr:hypothetical protein [Stigmatella erecta]SEU18656.1 hypothetical protein SAMN05443639_109117 [Stigmatella erecta]